eukprot:m.1637696 g.1637696  ORF g.1637696 m.1637696 type:complete len:466 (-) comp26048_c0_seq1:429-1826(-)
MTNLSNIAAALIIMCTAEMTTVAGQAIAASGPNISLQLSDPLGAVSVDYVNSDGTAVTQSQVVTDDMLTRALNPMKDATSQITQYLANLTADFTNMNELQTNATVQIQTQVTAAAQNIATNSVNISRLHSSISFVLQDLTYLGSLVNGTQNSIETLQQDLNDVIDVVNAVANCTGGVCVPRVANCSTAALPAPSNGGIIILGDHGGYAPVGTVADFWCQNGYYITGAARQSTCQASGQWSAMATASTCTACTEGCARCTGPTASGGCLSCETGRVLGFALGGGATFTTQNIDTDAVRFQMAGLRVAGSTNPAQIQNAKHLLVVNPPAPVGAWPVCAGYEQATCDDEYWVQADLGMDMYIGAVTVWHYYGDPRRYCNQRIALSSTGLFAGEESTIYDVPGYDFVETAAGNTVQAHGIRGRYVRHWASRSNRNSGVHFMGLQVTAAVASSTGTPVCTIVNATTTPQP